MPQLGDIKTGTELGFKDKGHKYIWGACPDCGKTRWIAWRGKPLTFRCSVCSGKRSGSIPRPPLTEKHKLMISKRMGGINSPMWKGGRHKNKQGYIKVKIPKDDFFYPMVRGDGYVLEHRLIMAKYLNRRLLDWEVIHHKNGVKHDNNLNNLELINDERWHLVDPCSKRSIKWLRKRVEYLEDLLNKNGIYFSKRHKERS